MSDTSQIANLRAQALNLFQIGLRAADPKTAIQKFLTEKPAQGPAHILAIGKAASSMMQAALDMVDAKSALIVTNYENAREVEGAEIISAGHPQPDQNGLRAGKRVQQLAQSLGEGDLLLLLLSGGGSALLPCPVPGVSLLAKQATNQLMLGAGMPIEDINLVRQNLSQLKGGGLAAFAAPARVRSLILSDVIGDDVRVIASGPTASPLGSAAQARQVLMNARIWADLPGEVQQALGKDKARADSCNTENHIIGSNTQSLEAMAKTASAKIMNRSLVGDVADAAQQIAQDVRTSSDPILLWGGETTVTLTGAGRGGRNQELALRTLKHLQGISGPWAFLSGGSDGIDGPTDAAGGLVTSTMTLDPTIDSALDTNDSYQGLTALGGLLKTGATGTNVADFQILCRAV